MKIVFLAARLIVTCSLLLSGPCRAEELIVSSNTQTRIAMIHSMDYASRTAVMSGYRYSFSGVNGYDHPAIRLYGSEFGSFSSLTVGMTVRVVYRLSDESRVVAELQQVADGTRLGVPDDVSG